jgi:hypothetical protein
MHPTNSRRTARGKGGEPWERRPGKSGIGQELLTFRAKCAPANAMGDNAMDNFSSWAFWIAALAVGLAPGFC